MKAPLDKMHLGDGASKRERIRAKHAWATAPLGKRAQTNAPGQTHPSKRIRSDCVRPKTHSSKTRSPENAPEQNTLEQNTLEQKRVQTKARFDKTFSNRSAFKQNARQANPTCSECDREWGVPFQCDIPPARSQPVRANAPSGFVTPLTHAALEHEQRRCRADGDRRPERQLAQNGIAAFGGHAAIAPLHARP